ncbi:hypothetical protein ASG30_18230 [Ramlibacter sp. Leaf400]|nr:hypothetical protein ASG30_18230 [Ramlibacter sp. Leaf400]
MLIALTLLGMALALGVPSLRDCFVRTSVSAGADALVAAMHTARMEALTLNAQVTICKSTDPQATSPACADSSAEWPGGWVVFVDQGAAGVIDGPDRVITTGRANGAIDAASETPLGVAAITFSPVGPVVGISGPYEIRFASLLTRGVFEKVICLSILGRARTGRCPA